MRIYNTETKTLEEFKPITPGKVSMYVCGPTVYNLIHIGNARPMMYKGYEVNYVSNFTDVDDKIIKKANEEGVDASVISERYIKECKKDMADLNVRPATTHPQATKEIQGMIDMISTLIDKGYAYVVDDGTVYFAVDKDPNYGELSHQRRGSEEKSSGLCALEAEERGRAVLGFPVVPGTSGLAYRMLGHVQKVSGRDD